VIEEISLYLRQHLSSKYVYSTEILRSTHTVPPIEFAVRYRFGGSIYLYIIDACLFIDLGPPIKKLKVDLNSPNSLTSLVNFLNTTYALLILKAKQLSSNGEELANR